MYFLQAGIVDIVELPVLVLLGLSVIPVLYRTVVTGDPAVNLGLLAAFRAGEVLSGDIAVFFTDGISR